MSDSVLDDPFRPLRKILGIVRRSFLLSMIGLGIIMFVVGSPIDDPLWAMIFGGPIIEGVLAGMFGIWGLSLVFTCATAYAVIILRKNY